jgi:hypothetical protein
MSIEASCFYRIRLSSVDFNSSGMLSNGVDQGDEW